MLLPGLPLFLISCLQSATLVSLPAAFQSGLTMAMDLTALRVPDQRLHPRCFCFFDPLLELDRFPYSTLASLSPSGFAVLYLRCASSLPRLYSALSTGRESRLPFRHLHRSS